MSILDTDWKGSPETLDDLAAKVENTDQLQGSSQRDLQENMPAVEIKHCPFDYGASATPLDSGVGSVVPFIDNAIICEAQPYHVIFDEDLNIRQMGNAVQMISSRDLTKTIKFGDIFYLEHPQIDLTARNILKYLDMIFMMQITKGEDETNGKRLTLSLRGMYMSYNFFSIYVTCYMHTNNVSRYIKVMQRYNTNTHAYVSNRIM